MKIAKGIFYLYILLLPIQLLPIFRRFTSFLPGNAAIQNDFFIMLAGLATIIIITRGYILYKSNSLIPDIVKLIVKLVLISVLASVIFFIPFGSLYGENTFSASFPSMIYLGLTGIAFYYNYFMTKYVKREMIERILDILCIIMMILGATQIAIINGAASIGYLYDRIDIFNVLPDSVFMITMGRICLTGSEPSSIGMIINVLLLPYCMGKILNKESKKKYKLYTVLLIVICFFSFSSTVYIGVLLNSISAIVLYFKKNMRKNIGKTVITGLVTLCIVLAIAATGFFQNSTIGRTINSLVIEKTTDEENMSTAHRYTTVINDIYAFLHSPIIGVGNGNQGFTYNEAMELPFINDNMKDNPETQNILSGNAGVANGGAFVPAFISGYGLIGVFLLVTFICKCVRHIKECEKQFGSMGYLYLIGGFSFLGMTTVSGTLDGNFLAIFVCSIPVMQFQGNRINRIEGYGK